MRYLLFLLFVLPAFCSCGQGIGNRKLGNRMTVLNERASFTFPDSAVNSARGRNIMAAERSENKETRIVLDIDSMRMVFFAHELYATAGNDMLHAVSAQDSGRYSSKVLLSGDSVLAVLHTPTTVDSSHEAILVNELFVRMPDNTVFVIQAFINKPAYAARKEYGQLAERVFASLKKGERRMLLAAHMEKVPISNTKSLALNLPAGFILTKEQGDDFEVYNLQKVNDIAADNTQSITIYLGSYPSYFHGDMGFSDEDASKTEGTFIGMPVIWLNFKNSNAKLYLREQKIPCDSLAQGLIIHVAMISNDAAAIDALTSIIEGVKVAGS